MRLLRNVGKRKGGNVNWTKHILCLNTNCTKYITNIIIVHLLYKQKRYIVHDITGN